MNMGYNSNKVLLDARAKEVKRQRFCKLCKIIWVTGLILLIPLTILMFNLEIKICL